MLPYVPFVFSSGYVRCICPFWRDSIVTLVTRDKHMIKHNENDRTFLLLIRGPCFSPPLILFHQQMEAIEYFINLLEDNGGLLQDYYCEFRQKQLMGVYGSRNISNAYMQTTESILDSSQVCFRYNCCCLRYAFLPYLTTPSGPL